MTLSRSRRAAAASFGLALALTGVGLATTPAQAAGLHLVVNEVYGAGGNSGALFDADFVELYNPTDAPVPLDGLSVHYRSAGGTFSTAPYALTGEVPAGATYLIQMSGTGTNGATLPTPDATASPAFSMAAAGGQVFLLQGTTPIASGVNGDMVGNPAVVDMVGASGAASFETAATATAASSTVSLNRTGGVDSDSNRADFGTAAPTPAASGTGGGEPEPPTIADIAEIQGTGQASPLNGRTVTTSGVVTAAYPTGGYNGFYLQTAGTGGATDATPGASDGLFVYSRDGVAKVSLGDHVQVTGPVSEYAGTTEVTAAAADVVLLTEPASVTPAAIAYPTTETDREAHEGELLAPTDTFTVTNNYATNSYGEVGLATGTTQLWQPTEKADAQDTAAIEAIRADNAARAVTLDDGSSWNYLSTYQDSPMPWLRPDNPVRVGSPATLNAPVILEFRNNAWKFQPQGQVTDAGAAVATFADARAAHAAPRDVGGDLRLGAMNVLNYFTTTAADWVAAGHACTTYDDRAGDAVTARSCTGGPIGTGPRGAAESTGGIDLTDPDADLERQRTKIVMALNTLDADVVSLEEIENSVALGEPDRDEAVRSLVEALNAAAGTTRWTYVPSPPADQLPALSEQDVIRTAFIYDPSTVETVGTSEVLVDSVAFANAREPLAQAFRPKGGSDAQTFAVIVNHFKSKGSGADDGTGQGNANPDRVAQARALVDFAADFQAERDVDKVFLTGDFNAYSMEDPVQEIEAGGFTNLASDDANDTSYQFGGMGGSLDHVFANDAALATVTGADVWQSNAEEAVAFEYSRRNYNAVQLYADGVFHASDHNPELVGISTAPVVRESRTTLTAEPSTIRARRQVTTLTATVSTDTGPAAGDVQVLRNGRVIGTIALVDGVASLVDGPLRRAGTYEYTARYLGTETTAPSEATTTVQVTNRRTR